MARPRGKAQTPERAGEEIFVLSEVPESWNRLPKTQKQAKELGQKYYFTGEPCKNGHFSPKLTSSYGCCACKIINTNKPEAKKRMREYVRKNRENINELVRARRANPNDSFSEEESARSKKHREKDIELTRARGRAHQRRYYAEDPEKARAYARRQAQKPENKAQRNKRLRERRKEDPAFLVEQRCRSRIGGVFRRASIPKQGETKELIGTDDWSYVEAHIASMFEDSMTWENRDQWHVDHVRPCESFNLLIKEQCLVAFNWRNLRPMWGPENVYKNDEYEPHHEVEWARRMRELGYDGELFLLFEEGRGGL